MLKYEEIYNFEDLIVVEKLRLFKKAFLTYLK